MDYSPKGVCSKNIHFDIEDNRVTNLSFEGGCHGNLQGIGRLVEGMNPQDVIDRLDGVTCKMRPTSCPDQLAQALKEAVSQTK